MAPRLLVLLIFFSVIGTPTIRCNALPWQHYKRLCIVFVMMVDMNQ